MSHAYCWRDGRIEIGRKIPAGAMPLARGDARLLKSAVSKRSRHAYDGKTFLVPGVPEADGDVAALEAVKAFSAFLTQGHVDLIPAFSRLTS